MKKLIKLPEVIHRTRLSRSTIYERMSDKDETNRFPSQVKQGIRAVAWIESEVDGWIDSRIARSRPDESLEQQVQRD